MTASNVQPWIPYLRDPLVLIGFFGGGEKRSRCGVLCLVSLDKEGDEDVRIDDDATRLKCDLVFRA